MSSKLLPLKTSCLCGQELTFSVKKPSRMVPSFTRQSCPGCGSRYTACCFVDQKGQPGRAYEFDFEIDHLSDMAREIAKTRKIQKVDREGLT